MKSPNFTCRGCNEEFPRPSNLGPAPQWCKACFRVRNYKRNMADRQANPERARARQAQYRQRNRDSIRIQNMAARLSKRHGIAYQQAKKIAAVRDNLTRSNILYLTVLRRSGQRF